MRFKGDVYDKLTVTIPRQCISPFVNDKLNTWMNHVSPDSLVVVYNMIRVEIYKHTDWGLLKTERQFVTQTKMADINTEFSYTCNSV